MSINFRNSIAVICILVLSLANVSCRKESYREGASVSFAVANSGSQTKATYADGAVSDGKQRIDWASGDKIAICASCPSSMEEQYKEQSSVYKVSEVTTSGHESIAKVSVATQGTELKWGGDFDHKFYCVYPSVDEDAVTTNASLDDIEGNIKASQPEARSLSSDLKKYMMMVGYSQSQPEPEVNIDFYPVTTCLDFTIEFDLDLVVQQISLLSSKNDEALSGDFKLSGIGNNGTFNCSFTGAYPECNSVSTSLIDNTNPDGVSFKKGDILHFRLFTNPCNDITEPFFSIKCRIEGKLCLLSTQLKYKEGYSSSEFKFHKSVKTNITGLLVKNGVIWADLAFDEPTLTSWEKTELDLGLDDEYVYVQSGLDKIESLTDQNFAATGGSCIIDGIVSYRIPYDNPSQKEGVPPVIELGDNWLTQTVEMTVADPPTYRITVSAADNPISTVTKNVAYHKNVLKNTAQTYTDVSLYNPSTGAVSSTRNTANCYVINAPGTYKIPMVYGNAIKNGSANSGSYVSTYTGSSSSVLKTFINHNGSTITSPYIQTVVGTSSSYSAELVWQDVQGLISSVGVNNDAIDSNGNGFVTFTVSSDNIAQGNGIIALKYGSTIVWSWHIWVTDEDLTQVRKSKGSSGVVNMMAVNLGWCATDSNPVVVQSASARNSTITITIQQDESGAGIEKTVNANQPGKEVQSGNQYPSGNCPYYQWGRKDPMCPSIGTGNTFKTLYTMNGTFSPAWDSRPSNMSIGVAIQNPGVYYNDVSGGYDWASTSPYRNLWSINMDKEDDDAATTKTVYDPSPVGFSVPSYSKLSGNSTSNTVAQTSGRTYNDSFYPYCGEIKCRDSNSKASLTNVATCGYYWISNYYDGNKYAYGFYISSKITEIAYNGENYDYRSNALSVCPAFE